MYAVETCIQLTHLSNLKLEAGVQDNEHGESTFCPSHNRTQTVQNLAGPRGQLV